MPASAEATAHEIKALEARIAKLEARLVALEPPEKTAPPPGPIAPPPRKKPKDPALRVASPSYRLFQTVFLASGAIGSGFMIVIGVLGAPHLLSFSLWPAIFILCVGLFMGFGAILGSYFCCRTLWLLWLADPRTSEEARRERSLTWSDFDWDG